MTDTVAEKPVAYPTDIPMHWRAKPVEPFTAFYPAARPTYAVTGSFEVIDVIGLAFDPRTDHIYVVSTSGDWYELGPIRNEDGSRATVFYDYDQAEDASVGAMREHCVAKNEE